MKTIPSSALPLLLSIAALAGVTPNPRLSVGLPVQANPTTNASSLTNGKFGYGWSYTAGSWAALKVGAGPSKLLVTWNGAGSNWSDLIPSSGVCKGSTQFPTSYRLLASANSSNGSDGIWDTLLRVTDNLVAARAHVVDFAGASWIKMLVLAGSGNIDELEVYDATHGGADSWFFMGTSITMMTFKSTIPDSNFSDLVHARVPAQTPSLVRGGVSCISSSQVLTSIKAYLDNIAGNHFLAIEMGTNDAWGGSANNLSLYTRNLQAIIDSARGRGIEPILARFLPTDSARAGWQVHPGFFRVADSLARKNGLIAGPDLEAWFRAHPEQLNSDGVHPSPVGAQSIQRLWADAMARNLYANSTAIAAPRRPRAARHSEASDAMGRWRTGNTSGVVHLF